MTIYSYTRKEVVAYYEQTLAIGELVQIVKDNVLGCPSIGNVPLLTDRWAKRTISGDSIIPCDNECPVWYAKHCRFPSPWRTALMPFGIQPTACHYTLFASSEALLAAIIGPIVRLCWSSAI
jgi:hypothetical protein